LTSRLIDSIENPKAFIQQQITVPGELIEGETVDRLPATEIKPQRQSRIPVA
jgi:hypothetical protein